MVLKGFKNSPISMSFLNTEVKLCANIQGFLKESVIQGGIFRR